jgi:ATP-dependent RNA helicase DeaD
MLNFNEFGLSNELLKAIAEIGFDTPTPVQIKTIPAFISTTRDIIALAQTGTGKTAAFGLPLIEMTDLESKKVQSLILCPTRELCIQITNDLQNYSKYIPEFRTVAVYGGASMETQMRALRSGVHVVVGTPGRTMDLIRRKVLKINDIRWMILDEADEMLNMGFKEDLDTILAETPEDKQTLLFSATMSPEITALTRKFLKDTLEISAGKKNIGAENVQHEYYMVHSKDRYNALKRIVDMTPDIYGIVFCRTRQETKDVADKLIGDGYNADSLHGDLSQAQRDHVMSRFRSGHLQLLVATDVAARGLDVNDLTHVINYNLPDELEAYIHRSGRTGRANKTGISVAIIHTRENGKIKELQKLLGKNMERKMVPNGQEICEIQLLSMVDKIEKVNVDQAQIEKYMPAIYKKLDGLSREELIKLFVSAEFNRFLSFYKNAPDLNVTAGQEKENFRERDGRRKNSRDKNPFSSNASEERPEKKRKRNDIEYSRFHINLGSKSNINPMKLIALINSQTKVRNIEIGKIDIERNFSFFETDSRYAKEVETSFKNLTIDNVKVVLSRSDKKEVERSYDRPFSSRGKDRERTRKPKTKKNRY